MKRPVHSSLILLALVVVTVSPQADRGPPQRPGPNNGPQGSQDATQGVGGLSDPHRTEEGLSDSHRTEGDIVDHHRTEGGIVDHHRTEGGLSNLTQTVGRSDAHRRRHSGSKHSVGQTNSDSKIQREPSEESDSKSHQGTNSRADMVAPAPLANPSLNVTRGQNRDHISRPERISQSRTTAKRRPHKIRHRERGRPTLSRVDLSKLPMDNKTYSLPRPRYPELGCKVLSSKMHISDGFCESVEPVESVICEGNCLPEQDLPWFAQFMKIWGKTKVIDYVCEDDVVRRKKVRLICENGKTRKVKIKVVRSCKCTRLSEPPNTSVAHKNRYINPNRDAFNSETLDKHNRKNRKPGRRKSKKNRHRGKKRRKDRNGKKRNRNRDRDMGPPRNVTATFKP